MLTRSKANEEKQEVEIGHKSVDDKAILDQKNINTKQSFESKILKQELNTMATNEKLFQANWAHVEMFEGDPTKLVNFLEEVEFLQTFVTDKNKESAFKFLRTRVTGRAKKYITGAQTIEDILKLPKPEEIRNELKSLRTNMIPTNEMIKKVETLAESLEATLKLQNNTEAQTSAISETVDALIRSTNIEKIKWGLEFGKFNSIKEVTQTFLKSVNRENQNQSQVLSLNEQNIQGVNHQICAFNRLVSNTNRRNNHTPPNRFNSMPRFDRNQSYNYRPRNNRGNYFNNRGNRRPNSYNRNTFNRYRFETNQNPINSNRFTSNGPQFRTANVRSLGNEMGQVDIETMEAENNTNTEFVQ